MTPQPLPVQDALEHLYAVLGGRIQKRRDYCAETSVHPPVSAQVAEIASAIAKLAEVHSP